MKGAHFAKTVVTAVLVFYLVGKLSSGKCKLNIRIEQLQLQQCSQLLLVGIFAITGPRCV